MLCWRVKYVRGPGNVKSVYLISATGDGYKGGTMPFIDTKLINDLLSQLQRHEASDCQIVELETVGTGFRPLLKGEL